MGRTLYWRQSNQWWVLFLFFFFIYSFTFNSFDMCERGFSLFFFYFSLLCANLFASFMICIYYIRAHDETLFMVSPTLLLCVAFHHTSRIAFLFQPFPADVCLISIVLFASVNILCCVPTALYFLLVLFVFFHSNHPLSVRDTVTNENSSATYTHTEQKERKKWRTSQCNEPFFCLISLVPPFTHSSVRFFHSMARLLTRPFSLPK